MPIGEFKQNFNLEGYTYCVCGSLDTREHMLTNCPLWIRGWTMPALLMPQERELLNKLDLIDVRSTTQPFN